MADSQDRAAERVGRALPASARETLEHGLSPTDLAYWLGVLQALTPHHQPRIELSVFDSPVLAERLADTIRPALGSPAALLVENSDRVHGRGYYAGFALRITADEGRAELGDGGLTTWTAQLTANAKERCLVSCIATERLTVLADQDLKPDL